MFWVIVQYQTELLRVCGSKLEDWQKWAICHWITCCFVAVDRRYCGMCSCSVNDDRRRRRPGRLDTGTSWFRYGGSLPFYTRYTMSASLKLTRSERRSQCSIARASDAWSSHSDEVVFVVLVKWVLDWNLVNLVATYPRACYRYNVNCKNSLHGRT